MDPTARRSTPYLVVRMGVESERLVIWDTVEITVGRHDTQDIVVPDPEVSRRHAVLQHRGQEFLVEDLGTPLRTFVNGEPIKSHVLTPGDVISIGLLELEFRHTEETLRPSGNTRFASQLKGFALPDDDEGQGGRTMLGVAMELPLVPPPADGPPAPPVARVVTADGSLEEASQVGMLAAPDDGLDLGAAPAVRDLDAIIDSLGPALDPVGHAGTAAERAAPTRPQIVSVPNPSGGEIATVTLSVQVAGPPAAVEALVVALCDKRIDVPPLVLQVKASTD